MVFNSFQYENFKDENKFYLRESRIHGLGVYCKENVPMGRILFKAIDHNKKITPLGTKINHCNNPNSKLIILDNNWYLISIKQIDKYTEITADYNDTPYFIKKPEPNWTC